MGFVSARQHGLGTPSSSASVGVDWTIGVPVRSLSFTGKPNRPRPYTTKDALTFTGKLPAVCRVGKPNKKAVALAGKAPLSNIKIGVPVGRLT